MVASESCPICRAYVYDWLRQPPIKDSEFYSSIRRKGILRRLPEISEALLRITVHMTSLTHETIIPSEDYNANALLSFYLSGVDLMKSQNIPEEHRQVMCMFYRNELIKCVFKQRCNTDLEYVLAVITDECCSRDLFTLAQWVGYSLFGLRHLEIVHNDHTRV